MLLIFFVMLKKTQMNGYARVQAPQIRVPQVKTPQMRAPQMGLPQGVAATNAPISEKMFRGLARATSTASSSLYILVVLCLVCLIGVIIYVIYKINKYSLKTIPLLPESVMNANAMSGSYVTTPFVRLPKLAQGNEYSMSFWIYVDNIQDKPDQEHKIILYQGNPTNYDNGTLFVYMDGNTNRMYFSARTNGADVQTNADVSKTSKLVDIRANPYFLHSTVEYVPIQRWLHFVVTVKDATMTVFMDGELYTVATIYEMQLRPNDIRPVMIKPSGDVMAGSKAGVIGVSGYIARAEYMNFAMTLRQVKNKYEEGPYKRSLFRFLGIPNIGMRSPFYYDNVDAGSATCPLPVSPTGGPVQMPTAPAPPHVAAKH
jgi:hypothetical protein